jgi:hypothetical protein
MSIDNRTTLTDCSVVFTGGDDTGSVVNSAGLYYEGGSAVSVQFSNADQRSLTTNIGGTRDLSDATCYLLVKDNLVETQANGGIKYVLYDGTNEIGYETGGNDNVGISLATFFNSYKLDVSNSAAFFAHVFAGSEANLNKAAITGVGFGTFHLSKAVGSIDNCFMDRFSFIANGSPALTINGGSSGTPITLDTVAAEDITNGWGLVSNPQGTQFNIFGPVEWGDSGTASSYFSQVDAQITLIGTGIGIGNFDMGIIANGTGTNLFQLDNCVMVNIGAASNWDFSTTNSDTMEIENCQFVGNGAFTFPVTGGTSRFCTGTTFVNCGQVNPSTMTFTNNTFIGSSDANGAMLLTNDFDDLAFTSDGTGHGIYITTPGTYDITDSSFSGYATTDGSTGNEVIYNNSGGSVTINSTGNTGILSVRNGASATTTIVAGSVTVTLRAQTATGAVVSGASVFVKVSDGTGPFPFQESISIVNSGTTATVTHTSHGLATDDKVYIEGASLDENLGVFQITVTGENTYTYTMSSTPGSSPTGTITATFVILNGLTDVDGEITMSRVFSGNQNFNGRVRKSTSAPYYKTGLVTGTVSSSTGATPIALMILDE